MLNSPSTACRDSQMRFPHSVDNKVIVVIIFIVFIASLLLKKMGYAPLTNRRCHFLKNMNMRKFSLNTNEMVESPSQVVKMC